MCILVGMCTCIEVDATGMGTSRAGVTGPFTRTKLAQLLSYHSSPFPDIILLELDNTSANIWQSGESVYLVSGKYLFIVVCF